MEPSQSTAVPKASRFASRRCLFSVRRMFAVGALSFFRLADPRFLFSVAATSVLSSKILHIYVHLQALAFSDLTQWSLSFFAQDTAVLLVLRLLLDTELPLFLKSRSLRVLAIALASFVASVQLAIATINITFFLVIGSEPRWRNVDVVTDSSKWSTFAEGIPTCMMTFAGLMFASLLLTGIMYYFAGIALDIVKTVTALILTKLRLRRRTPPSPTYTQLPRDEEEEDYILEEKQAAQMESARRRQAPWVLYVATGIFLMAQAISFIVRPNEHSLIFMSWTSIALPIADLLSTNSPLTNLLPLYNQDLNQRWDGKTALTEPLKWSWLPEGDDAPPGFEDWYEQDQTHYNSLADPLRQTNFGQELLAPLRGKLGDVKIRHVAFLMLESTRSDVFPFKKDSYMWKKLEETWDNKSIPMAAQERLATLTPTANFITGDYNDGFEHKDKPRRGGINAVNTTPSATYTLKSCTGVLCGLSPLTVDANLEYWNHIYQPCLPHIFKLFNALGQSAGSQGEEYKGYNWNSSFLMSVTGQFDAGYELMESIGYVSDDMIDLESMSSDNPPFPPLNSSWVNYMGWQEEALQDYVVDAWKTTKENNTRLFFTHLTSTAHYPYEIPETETYVSFTPEDASYATQDLSKYHNAIGYVDRWIGNVLDIIDAHDATNETLVVVVGDHGVPLPETGGVSPWGIPNIGGFRVPMVFSHPHLPNIDIQESVTAMSIVPTVLDLLIETGSLSHHEQQIARDLLHNYEGQSLIRSLEKPKTESESEAEQRWQFTAVSPGGQGVSTRSMDQPRWRLVVPLIEDLEWWFSDLENDPHEEKNIASFGFTKLLRMIEAKHGIDAAKWAEEAAFVTRWWVKENHERWRYNP